MSVRRGETERNWFRSERFERINGEFYFQARDGVLKGPFSDLHEAQMELMLYLRHAEDPMYQHSESY